MTIRKNLLQPFSKGRFLISMLAMSLKGSINSEFIARTNPSSLIFWTKSSLEHNENVYRDIDTQRPIATIGH